MRKVAYMVFIVLVLMVACEEKAYIDKEELIENIDFEGGYVVDTEKATYPLRSTVKFYEAGTNSYLKYKTNKNGRIYNARIYLTADDIKEYSKKYVEKYGERMVIEVDEEVK